ncbi:MAG: hypothetical protein JWN99_3258 [Ilumatobacteraceae bacterium]|nr:hypothetical protein [Ilumatobacteraceae bacterium]
MAPTPPITLDPDAQRSFDDLYWNTTDTVASIAVQFGVTSSRVPRFVTPLATGLTCWWCGRDLFWVSRAERKNDRPLDCPGCHAQTSPRTLDLSLQASDAVLVVTTGGYRNPKDLSRDIGDGTSALGAVGLRWSGRWQPVDVGNGPEFVRDAIVAFGATTVVVSSVRALGVSQGDAFAAFRLLLRTELRIITARDILWGSDQRYDSDRYMNRWNERTTMGYEFPHDRSDGGRSWADEYRMLFDDTSDDGEEFSRWRP